MVPEQSHENFSLKEINIPREEYLNGEVDLDFSTTFSNGMTLSAAESEPEIVEEENKFVDPDCQIPYQWKKQSPEIKITDLEGKVVYDFSILLPEGWSFAVPHSYDPEDRVAKVRFRKGWNASDEDKVVRVSDWQKPEELFCLMHEIGHAQIAQDPRQFPVDTAAVLEITDEMKVQRKNLARNPETKELISQAIKSRAFSERNASAWALKAMRKMSRELGIDIMAETGLTRLKLKEIIEQALRSHKEGLSKETLLEPMDDEEKQIVDSLVEELATEFRIR